MSIAFPEHIPEFPCISGIRSGISVISIAKIEIPEYNPEMSNKHSEKPAHEITITHITQKS